nr:MAG TPA: hypothetical protein [Bacteriophage sp.]
MVTFKILIIREAHINVSNISRCSFYKVLSI